MNSPPTAPRGFHVMTKPMGALCNLDCKYCFYLEKEKLYPENENFKMPDDVLESYVRQYIESQDVPEVTFAWQGGEPTLAGVGFFRKAVEFQKKYANGKKILNALQTNGTLLNDEWCEFLRLTTVRGLNSVLCFLSSSRPAMTWSKLGRSFLSTR